MECGGCDTALERGCLFCVKFGFERQPFVESGVVLCLPPHSKTWRRFGRLIRGSNSFLILDGGGLSLEHEDSIIGHNCGCDGLDFGRLHRRFQQFQPSRHKYFGEQFIAGNPAGDICAKEDGSGIAEPGSPTISRHGRALPGQLAGVGAEYIEKVPEAPAGYTFSYDANSGAVNLDKQ